MSEPVEAAFVANQKAASRAILIEACTFIIDGDGLDAEAAVSVMTEDERADLVNALDDLRGLIERVENVQAGASEVAPTACPSCGAPTWNGQHRNGHPECVMAEVEVAP